MREESSGLELGDVERLLEVLQLVFFTVQR